MIIKCKNCNGDVSDKAKECPHCGNIINNTNLIQCNYCGEEISENAVSCPMCGGSNRFNNEIAPMWVKVVCFIIPIIGWIIFAVNISTKPRYAKECFIASIILPVILVILYGGGLISILGMQSIK